MEKVEILERQPWFDRIEGELFTQAMRSSCHRSRCGSVIVRKEGQVIGRGYNSMPNGCSGDCVKDGLPTGFKSDKTCCVHSEQRAIMDMLKHWRGDLKETSIFFIRLDEKGEMKDAGKPYCTICSKMALDAGIERFVLRHKEGWTSYEAGYYNELSFKHADQK